MNVCDVSLQSDSGMEMMTPFPVPTHSRLQETISAVILTKEKPSFPVPGEKREFKFDLMSYNILYSFLYNWQLNLHIFINIL